MPRLPVVLGICVLAMALGAATVWFTRKDAAPDVRGSPAQKTASGQTPAVHVFGGREQREQALRNALKWLTSGQATELGALKDDLALLADEPVVVRTILEHFNRRASLTRYEAAGFADIFALVRHPDFVAPTARLLDHEEWVVRRNAIVAAMTQADPALTPQLDREYRRLLKEHPGEGEQTRVEILQAAVACGGDHLPVILDQGFADPSPGLRACAAEAVSARKLVFMVPKLLGLLEDANPHVRFRAGWSLAALGQEAGRPVILTALDPRDRALAVDAINAACEMKLSEAVPVLRRHLPDAGTDLRESYVKALVLLGDEETIASLEADLDRADADPDRTEQALAGLAAGGDPRHRSRLLDAARSGGWRGRALLRGLAATEGPPDLELVKAILRNTEFVDPMMIASVVARAGEAVVPFLAAGLDEARDENRAAVFIGGLGLIGSDAARSALIAAHDRWPSLVEQRLRLLDLARRRKGEGP